MASQVRTAKHGGDLTRTAEEGQGNTGVAARTSAASVCRRWGIAYDAHGTPTGTTRIMKDRSWGVTARGSSGPVNGHRGHAAGDMGVSFGSTSAAAQRRRKNAPQQETKSLAHGDTSWPEGAGGRRNLTAGVTWGCQAVLTPAATQAVPECGACMHTPATGNSRVRPNHGHASWPEGGSAGSARFRRRIEELTGGAHCSARGRSLRATCQDIAMGRAQRAHVTQSRKLGHRRSPRRDNKQTGGGLEVVVLESGTGIQTPGIVSAIC
jgi:hypothetical protein